MEIRNMPKLHSPFVRKEINGEYVVTPEIDPDYTWVFEEEGVVAYEKLDGTNVSIIIENQKITRVFNRMNEQDLLSNNQVMQAVRNAYEKGYCNFTDGQYFGEAVGPKIQSNKYNLKTHIWLPYQGRFFQDKLRIKSWGKYPKTYEAVSEWFEKYLMPIYYKMNNDGEDGFTEGVVFYHPDGRMAKLRRDMFDWYKGKRH